MIRWNKVIDGSRTFSHSKSFVAVHHPLITKTIERTDIKLKVKMAEYKLLLLLLLMWIDKMRKLKFEC